MGANTQAVQVVLTIRSGSHPKEVSLWVLTSGRPQSACRDDCPTNRVARRHWRKGLVTN